MIERRRIWWNASILTLIWQYASCLQYTPVALSGGTGDSECALLLNGPGRSSSYDYSLNLLRGGGGGFGYNGPHTCITYDAVNAAYLEARKRVQVAQPHGDYKAEEVATVGELLLDIAVNLARTYGLTYEDIEKGLPLIDTSKTLIREICPPFLSNVECRPGKYRRFDGLCTNLQNPTWGSTMQPFTRLIGPLYADGMTAPRISVTGNQLPLARIVSRTMHPDEGFHDHAGTVMVIAWGQFIDHDYTLTATPLDPLNRNDPEECCKRPPHLKNPYCNEILIPEDDYFYRLFHVRCIDFVRGFPGARPGCRLGSRNQFNTLTGVLDANTVYGVSEKFSRKLRSGYGGQLRMNPVFREYGLKDLLPLKLDIPDEGCTRPNRSMYCFEAGEIRVNEQLVLTCMHTLMAREHNRVAEGLAQVNPHWDDETLFQEARRINIAEIQHITYNEFLPILLGKEVMEKFGLLLNKNGYWNGYDSSVNPNVIDAFAAAAYRFGHSLLPTAVERWSKAHKFIASKRLSDLIRRPYDLYRAGVFDEYFMGLMNQVAQAMDDSITQEVTNHLFKKVGARFGMDLVSFNMQRGREFGLPGYMEFRKFCGLPGAESFDELFGSMSNETIKRYTSIFEHPSDVDLWSGGVSERPLPGSMLGPTFACIIATQFSYSRRGDRFWYELPNQPSTFTPEQLKEIKKARLARVICDNTDLIDSIQLYPMVLPDHEINPRVPCRSGVLPSIDFSKWADHGAANNFQQHQQQPFVNKPQFNLLHINEINNEEYTIQKPPAQFIPLKLPQMYPRNPYPLLYNIRKPFRKQIKILPPLLIKPSPRKGEIEVHRLKRDLEGNSESAEIEDRSDDIGTVAPKIDQVTQAITITQISENSPKSLEEETRSLNFQPFTITSSDYKNVTDANLDLRPNIDIAQLVAHKIVNNQPIDFDNYEILNDNLKDKDKIVDYAYEDDSPELQTIPLNSKEDINANENVTNESQEQNENLEIKPFLIQVPEFSEEVEEDQNNKNVKEHKESVEDKNVTEEVKPEDNNPDIDSEELQRIPDKYEKHLMYLADFTLPINYHEEEIDYLKADKDETENSEETDYLTGGKDLPLPRESQHKDTEEETDYARGVNDHTLPLQSQYRETDAEIEDAEETGNIKAVKDFNLPRESQNKETEEETENSKETGYLRGRVKDFPSPRQSQNLNLPRESQNKETGYLKAVEDFTLPLESENQEAGDDDSKYIDDIIAQHYESNERLENELEYPDLDKEYEKYRKSAHDSYLRFEKHDYSNADYPYEKENVRNENNEEHSEEPEEYYSESEPRKNNKQEIESDENTETQETKNKNAYYIPHKRTTKRENLKLKKDVNDEEKLKVDNITKQLDKDEQRENLVDHSIVVEHTTENIGHVLNKILEEKDAISRNEQIKGDNHPKDYNNYWTLEYKIPSL